MRRCSIRSVCIVSLLAISTGLGWGEGRVAPQNMYNRVIAVVPLVGKGTADDPRRPLYAPAPKPKKDDPAAGITGFTFQLTDDGNHAIVEFVARDRAALDEVLKDKSVKAFEKGKVKTSDIEAEMRKHKTGFTLGSLGTVLP